MTPSMPQAAIHGQPAPVRVRGDLVFAPRAAGGRGGVTVKDPLTLQFFQFGQEEQFVLDRVNGRTSAAEIQTAFARRFAPQRLELEELGRFVGRLLHSGLAIRTDPVPGGAGTVRRAPGIKSPWRVALANPFVIRFRGFDPQRLLDRLYPAVRWLFSGPLLACALLLVCSALLLIATHWDAFVRRASATTAEIAGGRLVWLFAAIALIKVLHEFGHALACRHFGGRCHELGFMLLVFTPCMYCNVSDAWLLPSKWHRAAIGAAGIAVELVVAAACTFLWWYSEPGVLHSLSLSAMMIASLGTALINGNPLMRYDGYFILSDLLDVPNLRQQATSCFRRLAARWVLGVAEADEENVRRGWTVALALFGAACAMYQWVVIFVIVRLVAYLLEPIGFERLAWGLGAVLVGGRLLANGRGGCRQVVAWQRDGLLRPMRFLAGCVVAAGGVAAAALVPLPFRVAAPCRVVVRDSRSVVVTVPGTLTAAADAAGYGDRVAAGQIVARLRNDALEQDVLRLRGELLRRTQALDGLRQRQFRDPSVAAHLPVAEAARSECERELKERESELDELVLRSPIDGTLLPPPDDVSGSADDLIRRGHVLDPRNAAAYLEAGTVVSIVGDPAHVDAILCVDQADIPFVQPGQPVRLRLPALSSTVAQGNVVEIAARELENSPRALVLAGRLPVRLDAAGVPRPVRTIYEVRVTVDGPGVSIPAGCVGDARINAGSMSLARRLIRYCEITFADRP
jgi:putative peptide zinc metalloprotease protein